MNLGNLYNRIAGMRQRVAEVPNVINSTVIIHIEDILDLNKDQMLLGRNNEGKTLTPGYTEDPYFKTPEAAQAYARKKRKLEPEHKARIKFPLPYPDKDSNTPNLIVTGNFQDAMSITTGGSSFLIQSSYHDSRDISAKYDNKVFGLAPESREYFYERWMREALKKHLYG